MYLSVKNGIPKRRCSVLVVNVFKCRDIMILHIQLNKFNQQVTQAYIIKYRDYVYQKTSNVVKTKKFKIQRTVQILNVFN